MSRGAAIGVTDATGAIHGMRLMRGVGSYEPLDHGEVFQTFVHAKACTPDANKC